MAPLSHVFSPPTDGAPPLIHDAAVSVRERVLTHREWLATLKRGDMVRVRTHLGTTMPPAMVTDDTPCYVFVGKLKFHRRNGWQTARQSSCVYRMKLRLVRDERDPG
jgi:hypothetical protein